MRRIFLLTGILRCFLILFVSILSIFALKVFFDEQTQLKWTTNYKINKLSFKVACRRLVTWRQLIGYITTHVVEFSRLSFCQRSKRFFRRDAGFFAPPLLAATKEKLICENFLRPRVKRRKASKDFINSHIFRVYRWILLFWKFRGWKVECGL